jgi:hypothetical protein
MRRETLTYRELANIMGYNKGAQFLRHFLGPIMTWCTKNELPALTSIVIRKTRGTPGTGLTTIKSEKFAAEQQRVYGFNWYAVFPPSLEELRG